MVRKPNVRLKKKVLNNKLIVCVRKKPVSRGEEDIIDTTRTSIFVNEMKINYDLTMGYKTHKFNYDRVYSEFETTETIFEENIIPNIMSSQNFICYTYGVTGSGKSYTFFGNDRIPGLVMLSAQFLINRVGNLEIGAYEIYQKNIYDLLDNHKILNMCEFNGEHVISNLKIITCNVNNINANIQKLINMRTMGESSQNNTSSRSHTIIQLKWLHQNLFFVDLAGCEKASKSFYNSYNAHREMAEINQSILALKECIRAVKNNQKRIPFRQSKLTMALKNSFHSHYNTLVINTVSPERSNFAETMNTLGYAKDFRSLNRIPKNPETEILKNNNLNSHLNNEWRHNPIIKRLSKIHELNNLLPLTPLKILLSPKLNNKQKSPKLNRKRPTPIIVNDPISFFAQSPMADDDIVKYREVEMKHLESEILNEKVRRMSEDTKINAEKINAYLKLEKILKDELCIYEDFCQRQTIKEIAEYRKKITEIYENKLHILRTIDPDFMFVSNDV